MRHFVSSDLKKLYRPAKTSHKGQNGKLIIVGGSHLFHGASLWALKVASRIVDMVFYASIPENNELTKNLKSELYDFIAIPRGEIENYIQEADCILIGPGMVRSPEFRIPPAGRAGQNSELKLRTQNLEEISEIEDESVQTFYLTKYLLEKYANKRWVIDAGSLQMMEPEWLKKLNGNVIITPHHKEFAKLFNNVILRPKAEESRMGSFANAQDGIVSKIAKEYNCAILLKGIEDIVCSPNECVQIGGGNEGMTKGGTGDVLAGLVAALTCKNDLFLAACSASFINKKAGDELYKKVGPYFNTSDLCDEIPKVMEKLIGI